MVANTHFERLKDGHDIEFADLVRWRCRVCFVFGFVVAAHEYRLVNPHADWQVGVLCRRLRSFARFGADSFDAPQFAAGHLSVQSFLECHS